MNIDKVISYIDRLFDESDYNEKLDLKIEQLRDLFIEEYESIEVESIYYNRK